MVVDGLGLDVPEDVGRREADVDDDGGQHLLLVRPRARVERVTLAADGEAPVGQDPGQQQARGIEQDLGDGGLEGDGREAGVEERVDELANHGPQVAEEVGANGLAEDIGVVVGGGDGAHLGVGRVVLVDGRLGLDLQLPVLAALMLERAGEQRLEASALGGREVVVVLVVLEQLLDVHAALVDREGGHLVHDQLNVVEGRDAILDRAHLLADVLHGVVSFVLQRLLVRLLLHRRPLDLGRDLADIGLLLRVHVVGHGSGDGGEGGGEITGGGGGGGGGREDVGALTRRGEDDGGGGRKERGVIADATYT